jgi:Flp pilus assembly protein TadB
MVGAIATATAVAGLCLSAILRDVPLAGRIGHPDAGALEDAGWSGGLRRWECLRATIVLGSLVVAAITGWPPGLAALTIPAPSVWVRLRAEAARERARRALGTIVGTAEAGLRSGSSLPEALRRCVDASPDPITARPLGEAIRAFDLGASLAPALTSAAERARDPRSTLALGTLALGIEQRLPRERMADLMAAVGERLAFEQRLEDEVHARAAGARQQQRLLAVLVPSLAFYLALTMPTLAATLGTDLGRFVLIPSAALLEVAGVILGRRIVRDVIR